MEIVDFSNLNTLSGGDNQYFTDVINIFIDSTSKSIEKLKQLAPNDDNHLEVSGVAHSIKSGVGIVQVVGMLDELIHVEKLAKNIEHMDEAREHLQKVISIFENALPILEKEKKRK
ncbi:MAG: Hpt domain-containing protein [Sphingobacteriales bacterium]|nr:MAG: Hpt domain-containing protein [Sphingobacteriales bacterium]